MLALLNEEALNLEYFHRRGVHDPLWQLILVRCYANAEGMFSALGITPLLVSLESMTEKP